MMHTGEALAHIKTFGGGVFLAKDEYWGRGYVASDKGPGKEWAAYSRAHMSRGSPLSCYSWTVTKYQKCHFYYYITCQILGIQLLLIGLLLHEKRRQNKIG